MGLFDLGSTICVQQNLSGAGVFDATPLGYARLTYSNGGTVFAVRATQLGVAGNALKLALVASGDVPLTVAKFDPTSSTLNVFLKRAAGTITATATDAVNAINAFWATQPFDSLKMAAAVTTDGTIPAALTATALTGGLDPVSPNPMLLKLIPASNVHGGLFYFEQTRPWYISSVTARFSATGLAVKVGIVNVDAALNAVSNEEVAVWEPTTVDNYAALEDIKTPVMPGQALQVTAAAQGMVRVTARFEALQSYL